MTDDARPLPPLGPLISRSFRLLATSFGTLFPLAFVPALAMALLGWLVGPPTPPGAEAPALPAPTAAQVAVGLLDLLVGYFVMGLMSLAALDALLGKRHGFGQYAAQTLRHLAPIVVLGTLLSIAIGLGLLLLVVPGFYIAARFFPWVPAIVFENAGWSGLTRARDLTAGYRWPLAGVLLLFGCIVLAVAVGLAPLGMALEAGLLGALLQAAVTGVFYALIAILTALVYARLREIKEGMGLPQIAALID